MSDRQLRANRANAQKSTGPRTEAGKQRSRLNGLRHGLTGQVSIMTDENRAAHDAFCNPIIARLGAEGPHDAPPFLAFARCFAASGIMYRFQIVLPVAASSADSLPRNVQHT